MTTKSKTRDRLAKENAVPLPNESPSCLQEDKIESLSTPTPRPLTSDLSSRTHDQPSHPRLPRFTRAQRQVCLALTPRDLEILALVESYRLLTSAHLQALAPGSTQGVLRRLQKLFHAGYLDRLLPQPTWGGGSQRMVYAVTNKGVRELQEAGRIEKPTATDWNENNRGLRDLFIRHTLLISHIRAVLTLAVRSRPDLRLVSWKEGPKTYDAIEVSLPEGYTRVSVAPDAYIGLEDQKGKLHFFLEADRGTMTVKRFLLKLKAYAAYWRERKHEERFGIRYFRVIAVTSSAERKANLAAAAEKEDDLRPLARLFLFTEEETLRLERPEAIFEKIWTMPATREPQSLIAAGSSKNPTPKEGPPMREAPHFHTGESRAG